jgi:Zn-dependent protease
LDQLWYSVISFACFIPAIVVHEVAHGFVAYKLGDPTAKRQGRLSLNPLKHVDPFGTVILPLMLAFVGGPVFGYAKPVPYNPGYFKNLRMGELLTGLAGPAANLVMGLFGVAVAFVASMFLSASSEFGLTLTIICMYFTLINFYLMFFNLIPLPPLDGSSIIAPFLSDKALRKYYQVQRYAMPILLILMFVVPYATQILFRQSFNPISIYLDFTARNLTVMLFGFL